ncbi:hypothetical protein GJ496_009527 [Pomphorhynchus laevis]|nr:hypothetical protein GJ496_009527 [Pomphorhynchus laevis]
MDTCRIRAVIFVVLYEAIVAFIHRLLAVWLLTDILVALIHIEAADARVKLISERMRRILSEYGNFN